MRTQIFRTVCLAFIIITGCNNSSRQSANNQDVNKDSTRQDVTKVSEDTTNDEIAFKTEKEKVIKENNDRIDSLEIKISEEKSEIGRESEKELNELKEKNAELEARLVNYAQKGKEDWRIFKKRFSKDMDSVSASIKRFTKKI
jgi:hypothetical protein